MDTSEILAAIRDRYWDEENVDEIVYRTKEVLLYGDDYSEVWDQNTQL